MIDPISATQISSASSGQPLKPSIADAADFSNMLSQPNPVNSSIRTFVEKAQDKLNQDKVNMDKKLREFDSRDSVFSLIDAMHVSAMKSVSVQLTGKIGTKVSEHFEQLIKQQ